MSIYALDFVLDVGSQQLVALLSSDGLMNAVTRRVRDAGVAPADGPHTLLPQLD